MMRAMWEILAFQGVTTQREPHESILPRLFHRNDFLAFLADGVLRQFR